RAISSRPARFSPSLMSAGETSGGPSDIVCHSVSLPWFPRHLTWNLSMQTRPLGTTGERVSALGFGCMGLVGWYGERNDAEAAATLLAAVDGGVTHLDTAASYQVGENEKFVGATLGARRKEVFLASKCGLAWREGKLTIDNSPALIEASCNESLKRLGTD